MAAIIKWKDEDIINAAITLAIKSTVTDEAGDEAVNAVMQAAKDFARRIENSNGHERVPG